MRIPTSRVVLDEITDDDVDALLDVRRSNPEYLARTEGPSGEVGQYDRSMLEPDLSVAFLDPSRQTLAVRLSGWTTLIGLVDLVREHPSDHLPLDRCDRAPREVSASGLRTRDRAGT